MQTPRRDHADSLGPWTLKVLRGMDRYEEELARISLCKILYMNQELQVENSTHQTAAGCSHINLQETFGIDLLQLKDGCDCYTTVENTCQK